MQFSAFLFSGIIFPKEQPGLSIWTTGFLSQSFRREATFDPKILPVSKVFPRFRRQIRSAVSKEASMQTLGLRCRVISIIFSSPASRTAVLPIVPPSSAFTSPRWESYSKTIFASPESMTSGPWITTLIFILCLTFIESYILI